LKNSKNLDILIIHKEPITERIPNLKAFIVYASSKNHKITLLTSKSKIFPAPVFISKNVKYIAVAERDKKLQLPTFLRFYALSLLVMASKMFRKNYLILAGRNALIFGAIISYVKLKKFSSFILEYPECKTTSNQVLSISDRLEIQGIRESQMIITHDKLHADFIANQLNITNIKYVSIPNGTTGNAKKVESKFLQNRLKIPLDRKILLHAGGFGKWFESQELSKESIKLSKDYELIFHVSHDISNNEYFKEYLSNKKIGERTLFSFEPVPSYMLDELISSAHIGIAWYSTKVLGYRATMLGLAAGKIGNYLKCGIPVIVPAYESFKFITEFCCGKQISDLNDLNSAIKEIDNNYQLYSQNALMCYELLWNTEKFCENLIAELCSVN
jgi:hypothetical protein